MRSLSFLLAVLTLLLVPAAWSADEHLTELEKRGKLVYAAGESASGAPITAVVSRGATPIPASILPCSGCHGDDGAGRPEGGVVPSDVSWSTLVSSYGHKHSYGRSHPAFDKDSIAASIIQGIDPAGNELDMAMPRYAMSQDDMNALLAYLKRVATDYDPGVSEETIRVGTLLPVEGDLAAMGNAMRAVIEASFADINAGGGIHGRKLELVVTNYEDDPVRSLWAVRDLLQQDSVFAMVGGFTAGVTDQLSALAEELEVPMIGPYTQAPREGNGLERQSFYLASGIEQQAAVLVRHRVSQGDKIGIVRPASAAFNDVVANTRAEFEKRSDAEVIDLSYSPPYLDVVDVARTMQSRDVDVVVFLGPAKELKRLANECLTQSYAPDLLFPGVFAGQSLFEVDSGFGGNVLIGYSSIPADHTPEGVAAFETLHAKHELGYEYSTAQISTFVAAQVFAEGLKRAGRSLSREKLLLALEGLADFQPGLLPPISYNRSRRIGAFGGYIMTLDLETKQLKQAGNWISLQL
jgi:ABC-type branched-subunit amino acid transport system substrate-binding protein